MDRYTKADLERAKSRLEEALGDIDALLKAPTTLSKRVDILGDLTWQVQGALNHVQDSFWRESEAEEAADD